MDDPLDALFLTPEEALVLEMKQWPQSKRDALKSMLDRREAALTARVAELRAENAELKRVVQSLNVKVLRYVKAEPLIYVEGEE